jgi:hypothetical protein
MNRTLRASLAAGIVGVVAVGGTAWFLGFPPDVSTIAGGVAGLLAAGLLLAVARRSDTFHDPDAAGDDPAGGRLPH